MGGCAASGEDPDDIVDGETEGQDGSDGPKSANADGDDGDGDGDDDGGDDSTIAADGGDDGGEVDDADGGDDSSVAAVDGADDSSDPSLTGSFGKDCPDGEDCNQTTTVSTDPAPIVTDPPAPVSPPSSTWTPNNSGAAPQHVSQADLQLTCQRIGVGVNPGYVRFGCNAYRRDDGQHYGIVKGWWRVMRRDGARSKAKDLNFREAGYDMAFDVPDGDAAGGVTVVPGAGEEAVRPCNCQVTN
jgi:hypothetical protein